MFRSLFALKLQEEENESKWDEKQVTITWTTDQMCHHKQFLSFDFKLFLILYWLEFNLIRYDWK